MRLIAVILVMLLCGCKSKQTATDTSAYGQLSGDFRTGYVVSDEITHAKKKAVIADGLRLVKETTTTTEYDTDKNVPKRKTETERLYVEDYHADIDIEKSSEGKTVLNDSLSASVDIAEVVESEVKEYTEGGQTSFGKWLGIIVGIVALIFIYKLKDD